MSQQGIRQAWFRSNGGSANRSYNENLIECAASMTGNSMAGKTVDEAEILLLQYLLQSTNTDINGLRAEMAALVGASNWSSVGNLMDTNV